MDVLALVGKGEVPGAYVVVCLVLLEPGGPDEAQQLAAVSLPGGAVGVLGLAWPGGCLGLGLSGLVILIVIVSRCCGVCLCCSAWFWFEF